MLDRLLFIRFFFSFQRSLELADALPQTLGDLGELLGAEHEYGDRKYHQKLRHSKTWNKQPKRKLRQI